MKDPTQPAPLASDTPPMPPVPRRILLVDEQAAVRKSIRTLIELETPHLVCGEAATEAGYRELLARESPDFLLLDVALEGGENFRLLRELRLSGHPADVLVLSMHAETLYALDALRAGANGYLMKADAAANIARAIQDIAEHKAYLSDFMWNTLRALSAGPLPGAVARRLPGLEDTPRKVFLLLAAGLPSGVISQFLGLAKPELLRYCEDICGSLGLSSLEALKAFAEALRKT